MKGKGKEGEGKGEEGEAEGEGRGEGRRGYGSAAVLVWSIPDYPQHLIFLRIHHIAFTAAVVQLLAWIWCEKDLTWKKTFQKVSYSISKI